MPVAQQILLCEFSKVDVSEYRNNSLVRSREDHIDSNETLNKCYKNPNKYYAPMLHRVNTQAWYKHQ